MAITYRQATLSDAADIHALLLAQAAEIPLLVDTLEREEALYALVRNCARTGESWVAIDNGGRVVGAVLAERAQHRRHYAEHEMLEVRYAVASSSQRAEDVLSGLIRKLLAGGVPVTAIVSPNNRSGLADCLQRLGFEITGSGGGQHFLWEPGRQRS